MSIKGTNEAINYGNAPRVTPEAIEEQIVSEHYFTAEEGAYGAGRDPTDIPEALKLLTICVLVLKNGFTITGTSACASPSNFSQAIGEKVARENAVNQIWPLLGYQLRDQLYKAGQFSDADVSEALTRMIGHSLGNADAFRIQDADAILSQFNDEGETGGETKVKSFKDQLTRQ